ncbi:MAG: VCBS repeat-containing protein [Candidatus Binatia bacterium]|nr:VCBS repeat-containing protein [Candidatus Binatia bacterium]
MDPLASYYEVGKVAVFAGDGRWGFSKLEEYSPGGGVHGMAVADFDHDGGLDIAVLYQRGVRYFARVLWSRGAGAEREVGSEFEGLGAVGGISAGDFDGDGWFDLAVSHSFDPSGNPWSTVSFYCNDGGVLKIDEPYNLVADYPGNPLWFSDGFAQILPRANGDFDGDGIDDLAVGATCFFPRATATWIPCNWERIMQVPEGLGCG